MNEEDSHSRQIFSLMDEIDLSVDCGDAQIYNKLKNRLNLNLKFDLYNQCELEI